MKKLSAFLIVISLLWGMSGGVFASARYWTNATGNRQWKDPNNWLDSFGSGAKTVPVYPDDAGIYGGYLPPILGGIVPNVQTLYVGYFGYGTGTLNIAAGDSVSLSYLSVGSTAYGNNPGIVNLSGGSLTPGVSTVIGNGSFNMTGGVFTTGTLSITAALSATAYMHLDGGTANVSVFTIGSNSSLDITGGTMIINGNVVTTVNGYVSGGKITAYNGVGRVLVDYGNINVGRTTVIGLRSTDGLAERDLYSDTWVATDAIGRTLPGYNQCGPQRNGKIVGIFYFIWQRWSSSGAYDVSKIIAANPFTYPTDPWYDNPDFGPQFTQWWGEPEAGYFVATDKWVIRRNMSMLANAGVDVLFVDATNAIVYWPELYALCDVMRDMRLQGNRTPQLCFLTHAYSPQTVTLLYNGFYAVNAYPELWFYWDGKPLMLGYPDGIISDNPRLSVGSQIRNFFTWRGSWAWFLDPNDTNGTKFLYKDSWAWLDTCPQDFGYDVSSDKPESVPVGIASHATNNIGRSNSGVGTTPQPAYNAYHLPTGGTQGQGIYFSKQWERGLVLDPNVIFITGWNEWTASWWTHDGSWTNYFLGQLVPNGGYYFVDAYNHEYSRDAEPMKGGYTDNYYYQMADNIRKFKGVRAPLTTSAAKTIQIDGDFSDWADVRPEYRDAIGDTAHRNSIGQGSLVYVNTTGRNDFVNLKAAYDNSYVYFFAETDANITPYTDPNWMLLFIDADQNKTTGWEGYDYLVNYGVINSTTTSLKSTTSGWNWTTVNNNLSYRASGSKIELAIPRSDIGETGSDVKFDFHWADNIQKDNDIIEFAVSGDSAPDRRFNYRHDTSIGEKACDRIFAGGQGKAMDLNSDCVIDFGDLAFLTADWLNPYTFTNFAELANDWLENYNSASLPVVTLLSDDFEAAGWNITTNWNNAATSDWDRVTTYSFSPTHSIECSSEDNDLISKDLNTTGKSSIHISFKYRITYIDADDNIEVQYYDGLAYDSINEIGDDDENVWLYYNHTIYNSGSDSQYFRINFRLKIEGTSVDSGEYLQVDDVLITATE